MSYLGNTPTQQAFTPAIDYFSGNGSTVAFTLSRPVASVAQVQAVIENVAQNPSSAFTVSGNTITFTSAPPSGTNNIYVYYTSPITQVAALPQNPQVFGNLQFSSAGARITGDFSNAFVANRVAFQTSTVNSGTGVTAIPNGTGTFSQFSVSAQADPNNASIGNMSIVSGSDFRFASSLTGTGTYLPMTFYIGGGERMRIDTSGNVGIGTSSPASYGSGIATVDVEGTNGGGIKFGLNGARYGIYCNATGGYVQTFGAYPILFAVNNVEAARIDTSGNFLFNSGYGSAATAYGCRAWVNFNGIGTVAIRASGNVSSITDNGTGYYTVNFTTAMPDANYSAVAAMNSAAAGTDARVLSFATTSVAIVTVNSSAQIDADPVCVAIFR